MQIFDFSKLLAGSSPLLSLQPDIPITQQRLQYLQPSKDKLWSMSLPTAFSSPSKVYYYIEPCAETLFQKFASRQG